MDKNIQLREGGRTIGRYNSYKECARAATPQLDVNYWVWHSERARSHKLDCVVMKDFTGQVVNDMGVVIGDKNCTGEALQTTIAPPPTTVATKPTTVATKPTTVAPVKTTTATSTTTGPGCQDYMHGTNFPNNDIVNGLVNKKKTPQLCHDFCKTFPNCVGWVWGSHGCWPKARMVVSEGGPQKEVISGRRDDCKECEKYIYEKNFPFYDIMDGKQNKKKTPQLCHQQCKKLSNCVGFVWTAEGCWPKTAMKEGVGMEHGIVAGYKNDC